MIAGMATTTKSTRKKPTRATAAAKATKTTKTKTTKTAASSRAAKTSASTRTKRPAAKKAVADKKPVAAAKTTVKAATLTPLEKLRSLHFSNAFLYIVFSGLIIAVINTAAVAVTLAISAKDEFASRDTTVLGPARELLYNIEPKYLLVASLLLSAIASILLASKLRPRYEASVSSGVSGFRWLTIGLSSALLMTFVNMLANIQDAATLKMSAALIVGTTMLAWLAERDNVAAARPKWLAYVLALVAGFLAWLPILGTFIGTTLYGEERFSWYVYAIAAVTLLGFTAFALRQYRQIKAGGVVEPARSEAGYWRIDLLTKFAVVLLVLIALQ